jgi:hypothetical protein
VVGYENWNVGHLPTKLIEFTHVNSMEFLLLKNRKTKKKLPPLRANGGGSLNSFQHHVELMPVSKTCKTMLVNH